MKQEIPELSLCLAHWFLGVWEFGASGSSLTRNVKPANPANCHGKVREVKKIILHCRLWLVFWHWENNFCQAKENLQSMGWGTESQVDRVALAAVPGPILCVPGVPWALQRGQPNVPMRTPTAFPASAGFYLQRKTSRQGGDKGCQSLTHHKDKCTTFLPRELSINLILSLPTTWWAASLLEIAQVVIL